MDLTIKDKFENMKILTGAGGMLGSDWVDYLKQSKRNWIK